VNAAEREELGARLEACLGDAARGLLWVGALLEPFLPQTAERIARSLGAPLPPVYRGGALDWSTLGAGARVRRAEVLFERLERVV
jgi:methionyl-tRNA synthetase